MFPLPTLVRMFIPLLTAAICGAGPSTGRTPFEDAVAVWHMNSAGTTLRIHGNARLGVKLRGTERSASIRRGGDGQVAEFSGGYLTALPGGNPFQVAGKSMTFCARLRHRSGEWNEPLFSRDDEQDSLNAILYAADGGRKPLHYEVNGRPAGVTPFYHLFAEPGERRAIPGSKALVEFRWRTTPVECVVAARSRDRSEPELADARDGSLAVSVPVAAIGASGWHDIVVRFNGPHLELLVDGVVVDEEWPYGSLFGFSPPFLIGAAYENRRLRSGFEGQIDHVAVWNRALSDKEIALLSGGKAETAQRESEILGDEPQSMQYWRPRGFNTFVGDCLPLFRDGTFHLFYLFDRRHHHSKWGLGAHQYAHASSRDLIHWTHHPKAVPLTEQWEPAVGTGNVIFHAGKYYAFYTDCGSRCQFPDKPHQGSGVFMASSTDGIHFEKTPRPVVLTNAGCADNEVFHDPAAGLFHMLTPARADDGREVTFEYTSSDLSSWTRQPRPFLEAAGACPHYFEWNGWHYFMVGGNLWKSHSQSGPWTPHQPRTLDSFAYPKSAAFTGNRRLMAGWIGDGGWGGDIVFRELVQEPDGTLGLKWPEEMIPRSGAFISLRVEPRSEGVTANSRTVQMDGQGTSRLAAVLPVPRDVRIRMTIRPGPGASEFGLCVRGSGDNPGGHELRLDSKRRTAEWGPAREKEDPRSSEGRYAIRDVAGMDHPFVLEVILSDDILDACIDGRRTLLTRRKGLRGDRLFLFGNRSAVTFDDIEIRPLLRAEKSRVRR